MRNGSAEAPLSMSLQDLQDAGKKGKTEISVLFDFQSIFYMLERVSDRAKNICEETLFVVAGEIKAEEVFSILFIDEENITLSQMAEAIAKKGYPASAKFSSAGRKPTDSLNPKMLEHMRRNGLNMQGMSPKGIDSFTPDIANIDVIISLQGKVRSYGIDIPWHTTFLTWDLGAAPQMNGDDKKDRARFEELQRDLSAQISNLMELLRGDEEG